MLLNVLRVHRRRFSNSSAWTTRLFVVILLLLSFIYFPRHFSSSIVSLSNNDGKRQHAHEISSTSISLVKSYLSSSPPSPLLLSPSTAHSFCALHNFPAYVPPANSPPRKVYDLFLLSSELDWLEIRLATLYPVVDYFIILESTLTFTGHEKRLLLARDRDNDNGKNWARIQRFEDKIVYRIVEGMPKDAKRAWDREDWQRDALVRQGVFGLLEDEGGRGRKRPELGDVLVVSDVDEIPRPATMVVLRNCAVPKRVTLWSNFYYYGFMWRHRGADWAHGQATIYAGEQDTILPVNLRNGDGGGFFGFWGRRREKAGIWNAGWHCSTCFERLDEVLGKMGSFSHVSFNQEGFRNREWIVYCVRVGRDIWNRKGQVFDKVDGNQDIPELVKESEKFKYLRDREGPNAGFVDYQEVSG